MFAETAAMPSPRFTLSPEPSTMPWLSRSPSKARPLDARSNTLGSGATVVRTPDEALRETGIRLSPRPPDIEPSPRLNNLLGLSESEKRVVTPRQSIVSPPVEPISPPTSPPLPPLPLPDSDNATLVDEPISHRTVTTPPRPTRSPPSRPSSQLSSRRSSMKLRSINTEVAPSVPPIPLHIAASIQPPPFQPLLVSDIPSNVMDQSKVIVTLETCTETYKTTLSTIHARPSHLSNYLSSLLPKENESKSPVPSIYSTQNDYLSSYRQHLTAQGLLPPSYSIHIFLDRPSSPYPHILSYLRASQVVGQPEVLPRALQLHSNAPQSRLETLIDVRDEAAFLTLDGLHKLCSDEIRRNRSGSRLHARGNSSSSGSGGSFLNLHSASDSICSLHTLSERAQADLNGNKSRFSSRFAIAPLTSVPSSPEQSTKVEPTLGRHSNPMLLHAGWI